MREIKFRAWDKWKKKWACFTIGQSWTQEQRDLYLAFCINGERFYEFTGLKDKNGREIYEGDILRQEEDNSIQIVFFEHGCFTCHSGSYLDYYNNIKNHIIIGNIYENPGLLKEK